MKHIPPAGNIETTFIVEEHHNLSSMVVMFTVTNVLFIFNLEGIFNQIRSQNYEHNFVTQDCFDSSDTQLSPSSNSILKNCHLVVSGKGGDIFLDTLEIFSLGGLFSRFNVHKHTPM